MRSISVKIQHYIDKLARDNGMASVYSIINSVSRVGKTSDEYELAVLKALKDKFGHIS